MSRAVTPSRAFGRDATVLLHIPIPFFMLASRDGIELFLESHSSHHSTNNNTHAFLITRSCSLLGLTTAVFLRVFRTSESKNGDG